MRKTGSKPRSLRFDRRPSEDGARSTDVERDDDRGLARGDVLKVERRYVVDGVVTCVTDKGRFAGVESVGSVEHIVVEGKEGTRMIPLSSVSEIEVVERAKKAATTANPFDPAYL